MVRREQKGFSAVEALLILVIAGMLAAVGWYVFRSKNMANQSYDNASSLDLSTPQPPSAGITSPPAKFVLSFYNQYKSLGYLEDQKALIEKYGTTNLLKYFSDNLNGVDPIVCAQEPGKFTVILNKDSDNFAEVTLYEEFIPETYAIKVRTVFDQNGQKIDSIKCPKPLPTDGGNGP